MSGRRGSTARRMRRRPAPGQTGSCPWRRRREPSRVRSAARPVDAWGLPWSVRSVHGAGVVVRALPRRSASAPRRSTAARVSGGIAWRRTNGAGRGRSPASHPNRRTPQRPGNRRFAGSSADPRHRAPSLRCFPRLAAVPRPGRAGPTVGLHRFAIVRPPLRGRPPVAVVVRRGGSDAPGFRVELRASPAAGIRDQERCPPQSSPAPAMPAARPRSACVRPDTKAGSSYAEPSRSRRISARRCRRSTCPAGSRWSGCSCDRRASGPETTSSSGSETQFGRSIRIAGRSCSKTASRWRSRTWSSQPEAARADSTPRGRTSATSFYLRSLEDADAIRNALVPGRRLVVVGGGYIGLEIASTAKGLGLEVCVVEAADRILGRVTAPEMSDYYTRAHRARGVDVRLAAGVTSFEGQQHRSGRRLRGGDDPRPMSS